MNAMNSSSSDNPQPPVESPKIEFLLKQVYAAYKDDMKILFDQLAEAKAQMSKRSPCSFCSTFKEQVQSLRSQMNELLQNKSQQSQTKKDACIQTDVPTTPQEYNKRTIKLSPPRKRKNMLHCETEQSPEKRNWDKEVILAPSTPEVILAPSTPEHNPQRESRVKRWLQTMEIPETLELDMLQEKVDFSPSLIDNCVKDNFDKGYREMHDVCDNEAVGEDMDETMLPLSYLQKLNSFQEQRHAEEDEQLNHSSVSEDLLDNANLHKFPENASRNVLDCVTNKATTSSKLTRDIANKQQNPVLYKYKADPVRKKAERMKLPGQQCVDCARFYADDEDGAKKRNICSKHRAANVAPDTPENFWELDFPDTQVCKERGYMDKTQPVKVQSRRRRPLKQLDIKSCLS